MEDCDKTPEIKICLPEDELLRRDEELADERPHLCVLWSDKCPAQYPLAYAEVTNGLTVGKDGLFALRQLGDGGISRQHFVLGLEGKRIRLSDLSSKNGTWVNGHKVTSAIEIRAGDVILASNTVLTVTVGKPSRGLFPEDVPDTVAGCSPSLRRALLKAHIAACAGLDLLVLGPTGAGKTSIVEYYHSCAKRNGWTGPLKLVNCAGLEDTLLDSQVFGHCRGAFTGAVNDHPGLVGDAEGGTLWLDEAGEASMHMQAKFFTFLDKRTYRRVGETRDRTAHLLVAASTNRIVHPDEPSKFMRPEFRGRLARAWLYLAAIRSRPEDIVPIVWAEIAKLGSDPAKLLNARGICALLSYHWPENVREIQNVILANLNYYGKLEDLTRLVEIVCEKKRGEVRQVPPIHCPSGSLAGPPPDADAGSRAPGGIEPGATTSAENTPKADKDAGGAPIGNKRRRASRLRGISKDELLVVLAEHDHNVLRTAHDLGCRTSTIYRNAAALDLERIAGKWVYTAEEACDDAKAGASDITEEIVVKDPPDDPDGASGGGAELMLIAINPLLSIPAFFTRAESLRPLAGGRM